MSSENKIVASIGDSVLRENDVELLEGPHWLTDNVISFYFEYLANVLFKEKDNVLFISPEVTHCLKAAKHDELKIFLDPLKAKEKDFLLFALNDNKRFGESGGSHWSLLVFCKAESCMYHIDSMSPSNHQQAMRITGKLIKFLTGKESDFQNLPCIQQKNNYDCGIFLLAYAEYFMQNCDDIDSFASWPPLSEASISSKRSEILQIVRKLSKEQQRT